MPEAHVDHGLALKITPPKARRVTAPRAWLARNCEQLRDHGIGLIRAPGGFGKTTLLCEWRRELLVHGTDVGWLLLDRRDDGARFVTGLVACLRIATGDKRFGMVASQAAKQPKSEIGALTELLAEIIGLAHPVALLLDDLHELPDSTTDELIPYLLYNRPPNLQLVFGTRQSLRTPTSELAARGDLASRARPARRPRSRASAGLRLLGPDIVHVRRRASAGRVRRSRRRHCCPRVPDAALSSKRRAAAKRREKERTMPRKEAQTQDSCDDLQALIDQELHALPEKYRDPIVLCDLQGKTRQEAARKLGCPEGTPDGGQSCVEVCRHTQATHLTDLHPSCLAAAKSKEQARACGSVKCGGTP